MMFLLLAFNNFEWPKIIDSSWC